MFDVIVVGAGPAGLSAALMLGRCRRRVLVCDLGQPRNRRSRALHGYLTRDGIAPAALNDLGRAELQQYGIEFRCVGVTGAAWQGDRFAVSLANGGGGEQAQYLLLATGVIDDLPLVPGLEACYGQSAFHCPYCDGWEWRDRRFVALGRGKDLVGLALGLRTWSHDVLVCTNGARLDRGSRQRLARNRLQVNEGAIARFEHTSGLLSEIVFVNGESVRRDVLFFTSGQHPQSDLAISLGCELTRRGTVKTDLLCTTNVPHLFVAGDASRDAQFVVVAAAEGVKAAVAINKALQKQELAD